MQKIITATAATFVLTACGSASEDPGLKAEPTETTTAAAVDPADAVREAYDAFSKAFLSGDGAKAWDFLSKRCQDTTTKAEIVHSAEQATAQFGNLRIKTFKAEVEGAVAKVTFTYENLPTTNQADQTAVRWIKEDGSWKGDEC